MLKLNIILLIVLFIGLINAESKVIKKYVEKYDPNFKWTLNATYDIGNANVHVLEFISHKWLSINETDSPVWKHWLQICIPKNYDKKSETGILFVENGVNQNWTVPTASQLNSFGKMLCSAGNQVTATLLQSPNQFIMFENDGVMRKEDDIVAYTWIKFMNNKNTDWISLNPQTKSATRAMDAVQQFGKTATGNYNIKKFVVTGASKRGWATYGTAMAKDPRVIGIAPMVISVLNLVDNIGAQIQSYGNWSFALQDYMNHNVTKFLYTKYFEKVTEIIDPINYIKSLKKVNKLVILGTADEFFIPDSTKFFYSKLKGETKLALFANTNHGGILKQEVANTIVNFYNLTSTKAKMPQFSWSIDYSSDHNTGKISLKVKQGTVEKVLLYSASTISTTKRDFRMFTCPAAECYQPINFLPVEIQPTSTNTYTYTMTKPQQGGWTGFYMNVHFSTGSVFSSEMAVVPDVLPFAKCTMEECGSGKPSYVNDNDDDDQDDDEDDDDQC
ncbi:hypothetical protein DICPUDRAFT_80848 [Dictyostelium purpureum]|uniref:Peptidase S9 prolyl oligopeptidase catalytic domain-containing protein n=1 Tax=Dictyostelium purpureum TaxID=5786 RepID=F0ZRQ5_DICPU|nr:uncharacterized protein DICPUDRAFT_80848 [Dictyostelium purpureum]EGC33392.1 hypothetical protein DICPUDRAFT_80848 [Dictyostelium purpureum]|eukprot:XP_003290100.1 hypothetical protein DICPUDRAFT_80848 [Dictyostelium purpureum]